MSEDPGVGPVAVLGDERGAVSELIESVGIDVRSGIDAATTVIAVGEEAMLELARRGCSTPVLPVAVPGGIQAVPANALQQALQRLGTDSVTVHERPALAVDRAGERVETGLLDVMVVTAEPAHISEYALSTPADQLSTFRADGVVAATPAGSHGYARRVGGPLLSPDLRGLSVVPVGAFKTERNHWVVSTPPEETALSVTVERDEAPVALIVDGRDAGTLPPGDRLDIAADGTLSLLVVPESESAFQTGVEQVQSHRPERRRDEEDGEQAFPLE
ncbi:MAG: NAD(+)/NADH kinase [Halorhabdus sp.]